VIPPAYPTERKLQRFFAIKFLRLLVKTAAAQTIGTDGCWLLTIVVNTEDKIRYRRAVTFFNEPLMSLLGFTRWHRLDAVRSSVVAAGWLHYEAPPKGSRGRPGIYWVTAPEYALDLPDDFMDEGEPSTESVGGQKQPSTENVDAPVDAPVDACVEPPIPIPSPTLVQDPEGSCSSCPDSGEPDEATGIVGGESSSRGKAKATEEDVDLANWFWQSILEIQPGRKPPRLERWAESIRIIRERDGRSHDEIRALITLVQRDPFWRVNVLSPDKLRQKWDDLELRLKISPPEQRNGHGKRPTTRIAGAGERYQADARIGEGF
jgi:hypothetical protein